MNFYKHHLGDYARDTAHLSILEHGAYLLMLHHHYATEAPLPADPAVICRIIRASSKAECAAVTEILSLFWTLTPSGWVNRRAATELEAASELRNLNREKGKRGGRPAKPNGKAGENPAAFSRLSVGEPNGITEQKPSQTPDSKNIYVSENRDSPHVTPNRRQPAAERHRNAVAIADEYARAALAAEVESRLQRAHAVAISPSLDIAVGNASGIRTAPR